MEAFEHALYTLWQPDECRAELALEKTVSGIKITVFSCSDTVNIQLHKTGRLEIGLNDERTEEEALARD